METDYEETLSEIGSVWYQNFFPYEFIWNLVFARQTEDLYREFAITLRNKNEEKYDRNLHVESIEQFKNKGTRKAIEAFHVGCLKSLETKSEFNVKELTFDLDLDAYSELRQACCKSEKKSCEKCMCIGDVALRIMDYMLRNLGFEKLLFSFSGRKGFHCRVFDDYLFECDSSNRSAIINYLSKNYVIIQTDRELLEIYDACVKPREDYIKQMVQLPVNEKSAFYPPWKYLLMCLWPILDVAVTTAANKLTRLPYCFRQTISWGLDPNNPKPIYEQINEWNHLAVKYYSESPEFLSDVIELNIETCAPWHSMEVSDPIP